MSDSSIHLITRADDLGAFKSGNSAVADILTGDHILKNISVMAPAAYIDGAAELFSSRKDICFGLHLTLNSEWNDFRWKPVLSPDRVRSLVYPDGTFMRMMPELLANKPAFDEVTAEAQAQLDKVRNLGFDIRYVDEHMMVVWALENIDAGYKDWIAGWAEREGLIFNREIGQRFSWKRGPDDYDQVAPFLRELAGAAPGTYLVIGHPAFDDAEMRRIQFPNRPLNHVALSRDNERRIFCDPRIVSYCKEHGVLPISYCEAAGAPG